MYSEVPLLLGCVPSPEAAAALGARGAARPVSTLEFAWEQGLLITGHEGGEVRKAEGGRRREREERERAMGMRQEFRTDGTQ
jgi:hypothetical protein